MELTLYIVEWSVKIIDIVEWSVLKWGAGTDVVESSSYFPMIGAQQSGYKIVWARWLSTTP